MDIYCIVLLMSCAVSLWSFFPITKEPPCEREVNYKNNLTFWGDIAACSSGEYLNKVLQQYFSQDAKSAPSRLAQDMANAITSNSKIALRKYRLFKAALFLDVFAVLLGAILCILA